MSEVVIVPIIKVLDPKNNIVKVLLEESGLPEFSINTANDIQPIDELNSILLDKYEIKGQWTEIYYVGFYIAKGALRLYYSTFVPEGFLNEKVIAKMSNVYGQLPVYDGEQIKQSLSILPY